VQAITEIAKTVGHLTVFQRSPNWCAPLHNSPIDAETQRRIKASYPEIFAKCRETYGGFIHDADRRNALEVSPEVREAFFEKRYGEPGFALWMGNFPRPADRLGRERDDHRLHAAQDPRAGQGSGARGQADAEKPRLRHAPVPMESGYYEVFNQPNVRLVDLTRRRSSASRRPGSRRATPSTAFDMIIYATGFDAITGPFDRIDIRGVGGRTLKEKVGRRAADLSRAAGARLSEPLHARRTAQRIDVLQHDALHRAERGLGDGATAAHARARLHARRAERGCRSRMDRARPRNSLAHALSRRSTRG
jgi:cation diffusion facilitator CzcD-associated flavoprotein CzcO